MSEEDITLLKKNIELFLWRMKEIPSGAEAEAGALIDMIRQEGYEIRRWRDPDKYLLIPEGERAPVCRGCFNEHGDCGTPCASCEKWEQFQEEWAMFLFAPDRFWVWARRGRGVDT